MLILDRNEKLRGNMEWLSVAVIQHKRCTRIKDAVEISMGMLGMKKDKDQGYSKLERIINPCLQKKKTSIGAPILLFSISISAHD